MPSMKKVLIHFALTFLTLAILNRIAARVPAVQKALTG